MIEEAETAQWPDQRFFVSYTGVKLPFTLVNPIAADALSNRNTFIRAYFDARACCAASTRWSMARSNFPTLCYHDNGALRHAAIVMLDEEPAELAFDAAGIPLASEA